ncbi:MAG: hypothetical protein PHO48_04550 [Candidatus Gracilibacteria bacterium]|nr:hypothetical protein [Candidatus Gracilibacteria bacterium]MDD5179358.1 hypothetical protein [Candidatus Gracilibacteria bacterium]
MLFSASPNTQGQTSDNNHREKLFHICLVVKVVVAQVISQLPFCQLQLGKLPYTKRKKENYDYYPDKKDEAE